MAHICCPEYFCVHVNILWSSVEYASNNRLSAMHFIFIFGHIWSHNWVRKVFNFLILIISDDMFAEELFNMFFGGGFTNVRGILAKFLQNQ